MSGAQIDLTQLTVQQLQEIRKQLDQELEHLSNSHMALRQAKAKFISCMASIKTTVTDANDGKAILVPLTSSLYVPGHICTNPGKVIVDIGTGYYIEKTASDATKFYTSKIASLEVNIADLERIINAKGSNIQTVTEVMTQKMQSSQAASA